MSRPWDFIISADKLHALLKLHVDLDEIAKWDNLDCYTALSLLAEGLSVAYDILSEISCWCHSFCARLVEVND